MNNKVAVFQVVTNGIDGRGKTSIQYSNLSEVERDSYYESLGKNKCYSTTRDVVLDLNTLAKSLLAKLDGNDRLILKECLNFDSSEDSLSFPDGDRNRTLYVPTKKA